VEWGKGVADDAGGCEVRGRITKIGRKYFYVAKDDEDGGFVLLKNWRKDGALMWVR
jgi:hypothetical protein